MTKYDKYLRQDLIPFWRNTYGYLVARMREYGTVELQRDDYVAMDEMGSTVTQLFDDKWRKKLDEWAKRGKR